MGHAYQFDELTSDDVLDEVHSLGVGVGHFTEYEHLEQLGQLGVRAEGVRRWTIWEISWKYLYSRASDRLKFAMVGGTRRLGWGARSEVGGGNGKDNYFNSVDLSAFPEYRTPRPSFGHL